MASQQLKQNLVEYPVIPRQTPTIGTSRRLGPRTKNSSPLLGLFTLYGSMIDIKESFIKSQDQSDIDINHTTWIEWEKDPGVTPKGMRREVIKGLVAWA